MFNIKEIIETEAIDIHFQPIISIYQKRRIGFEALCRGSNNFQGISPEKMLAAADSAGVLVEFDRLCRRKAFESFSRSPYKDSFLFINFSASIVDKGILGSMVLYETVLKNNLLPKNIVIEIVESKVKDISALKEFIAFYRDLGFTIALDDIGSAYSNLERISMLKPDILKIDRSLISNINQEYYKREILKSLVNLGKGIGALIIGEGIETENEALTVLDIGADMLQGYYVQKPMEIGKIDLSNIIEKTASLTNNYKNAVFEKSLKNKKIRNKLQKSLENIVKNISGKKPEEFTDYKHGILKSFPDIECMYFLDKNGFQVTPTIFPNYKKFIAKNSFFHPSVLGTDHSMKDYFYQLKDSKINFYNSSPYISRATGNLCTTLSSMIKCSQGNTFILCIDIKDNSFIT